MKKRLLSLLIVLILIIGTVPEAFADSKNPFSSLRTIDYDEKNGFTPVDYGGTSYNLGSGSKGSWVKFANVNFGTKKGVTFTINHVSDISNGCDLVLMKNAPTVAEGGIELGRVESLDMDSWSWDAYQDSTIKVTNPNQCTGTFDLYFRLDTAVDGGEANFGNMRWFYFSESYTNVTAPTYSGTTTIGASANVDRYINDSTKKAMLLLAEYSADGTMIALNKSTETVIADGVSTSFSITGVTKNVNTSYLGAFLWQNDNISIGNASIGAAGQTSGNISAEKINVDVTNTVVGINGSQIADDRVIIAVVEKNSYDSSKPLYDNAPVQIWETAVADGKYDYKFKMNLDLLSGSYYAIVKGKTTSEIKEFSYKSPYDTYLILNSIDNNASDSDVVSVLSSNSEVFGIEAELYSNMQAFDMNEINTNVQQIFDTTPLSSGLENYDLWINAIKTEVLPQAVISYIKNGGNVSKISNYVVKYDTFLGIDSNSKYIAYYKEPSGATQAQKDEYAKNRNNISNALTKVIQPNSTVADFVSEFEEAVIVSSFNSSQSWGYVDEALRKFASEIPVDISEYVYLKNNIKNEMMDKFLNRNFERKSEIKNLFESLIGTYAIPENREELKYDRIPSELGEEEIFAQMIHFPKTEEMGKDNAFSDIAGVAWAVESINYMSANGYVNGKGNGNFDPNGYITREEFAAIVARVFDLGVVQASDLSFIDVDKDAWYAPYVAVLVKKGIVNGVEKNRFGVGEFITREQIAAILKRAAQATYKNILPSAQKIAFADSDTISDWAYDAVFELARAGVINGKGKDMFSPKMNATRAEAAVMLYRLLQSMI